MNSEYLEMLRKTAIKKIGITVIGTIFICFCFFYSISLGFESPGIEAFFYLSPFIVFIVTVIKSQKEVRRFKIEYKRTVVLNLFKDVFQNIKFFPDNGISKAVIDGTEMIYTGDKFYSGDYISAKYKNVPFEFSDILMSQERIRFNGKSQNETIFFGQWYIFDFNKKFKTDVMVCEKSFENAKCNIFLKSKKFNEVQLEDILFNEDFKVFARNGLEAFYILTPGIIEKIKELNKLVQGKLVLCFVDNKLHIGLDSSTNLFEPDLFKKVDISENCKRVVREIQIITHFIDILELDNDLFM